MKLSHTAALALLGWLLIVPVTKEGKEDPKLPLSQWTTLMTLNSEDACRRAFVHLPKTGGLDLLLSPDQKKRHRVSESTLRKGECIADNDPRLKKTNQKLGQ